MWACVKLSLLTEVWHFKNEKMLQQDGWLTLNISCVCWYFSIICRSRQHYINIAIISITLSLRIFHEACLDTWKKKIVVMWWSCCSHFLGTFKTPVQLKTTWLMRKKQVSFNRTHPWYQIKITQNVYCCCLCTVEMPQST